MSQTSNARAGGANGLIEDDKLGPAPHDPSEAHSGTEQEDSLGQDTSQEEGNWTATTQIKLILVCLAIVSIVVALDATILVAALPVSIGFLCIPPAISANCSYTDTRDRTAWHR